MEGIEESCRGSAARIPVLGHLSLPPPPDITAGIFPERCKPAQQQRTGERQKSHPKECSWPNFLKSSSSHPASQPLLRKQQSQGATVTRLGKGPFLQHSWEAG